MAHDMVQRAIEPKGNRSGYSQEQLETGTYAALSRFEAKISKVFPAEDDPGGKQMQASSVKTIEAYLTQLVVHGPEAFVNAYQIQLKDRGDEAEAVGLSLKALAQELGIETSIMAQYRQSHDPRDRAAASKSQEHKR